MSQRSTTMKRSTSPILFDSRWLGPHGIGRFARELRGRLPASDFSPDRKPLSPLDPWLTAKSLSFYPSLHYVSPGFNAVLGARTSFSLTVHDLIHLRYPGEASISKKFYYNTLLRRSLRSARNVFTVSDYSKADICEWAGIATDRVHVIGNGVSAQFRHCGASHAHGKPYIFYVGNKKPHKNVEGFVRAYALSAAQREFDFLLTGTATPSVARCVESAGVGNAVHFLHDVAESKLAELYRGARALVMPSFYEGFGLPIIEAMASGTAVLCSDCTALPEVAGDAASYFDPFSEESMAMALDVLSDDEKISRLEALGLARSQLFQWDNVAANVQSKILDG